MSRTLPAALTAALALSLVPVAALAHDTATPAARPRTHLPLGASDLPERRTTTRLARGVTLTTITRGVADTTDTWTVEVASPDRGNPDPDAPAVAITDRSEADATAAALRARGLDPRVEEVRTPPTADYSGSLGYRVRVGSFATKDAATPTTASVKSAGYASSVLYTGWDDDLGAAPSRGAWHLQVVTVDPRRFRGRLRGSYGPDFVRRETTSALARASHAIAATNAGFFVLDPAAGAPGAPAGVGVYRGRIESATTDGRPALIVHDDARRTQIKRLWWRGRVHGARGRGLALTGLNRVPGKIRNCGVRGGHPTSRPEQDVTCTRTDELVAFDHTYGSVSPTGAGAEVVLGRNGQVRSTDTTGGARIPRRGSVVQATGAKAARLLALARRWHRLSTTSSLRLANGHRLQLTHDTTIVNGAPVLVQHGRVHATPRRDGSVHPGDPSFYYGWGHKRNPRTFAGVDRRGRFVLVTADGRSTDSLGLSIAEAAAVARSLGLREAMNLDGGGSTTTVVRGRVVNVPSDATGERPVGDVLEVLRR